MSSLAAPYFAGVVGAGLDKLSQEERRRIGGARAFIPASEKSESQNLDPSPSSLSPVFALVCCAHVPPSAYIGWQFPSPGSSGQLQADSSLLLASLQVVASLV